MGGLVLSRRYGESIVIEHAGERLVLVVMDERRGEQVKLHFTAPQSFAVHRMEVQQRIERERERAAHE